MNKSCLSVEYARGDHERKETELRADRHRHRGKLSRHLPAVPQFVRDYSKLCQHALGM